MPDPGPLKRTLYPPSHSEPQSKAGDDVIAVKRAISRAGFWKWQEFSDDYTNAFAHGDDENGNGVAGYQRSVGLDGTGTYGKNTHEKLRKAKVPKGGQHAGDDVFDGTACELYSGSTPPGSKTPVERVREKLVEFCTRAIAEPDWYYSQNRAVDVSVNPNGPTTSDCSGSTIQAFHYAKRETGLDVPDPSMQGWSGYGNTNYYEDDHPKVTSGSYQIGDLAHYDGHVCLCFKAGNADTADWFSFGSEPPSKRKLHYRTDFRKVVRPPLVKS
jgi:hypothetical protein